MIVNVEKLIWLQNTLIYLQESIAILIISCEATLTIHVVEALESEL